MSELYPVRCPGMTYRYNVNTGKKEFMPCNALLFKLSEGGKCETVCRQCKTKVLAVVRQTLGQGVIIDVRQENDEES